MKINFSLRSIVVFVFIGLFLGSLLFYSFFILNKLSEVRQAFSSVKLDISAMEFKDKVSEKKAIEIQKKYSESLALTGMVETEARMYTGIILFIILLISISLFVLILYYLTKPLEELKNATAKIRDGDFSIHLPETGLKEMIELKVSFNNMSEELDQVQKKLLVAEKEMMWKELSRILAHEIKNPLTPIKLAIQRLEEKFVADKTKFDSIFQESAEIINQEINNLRELVQSFSNFAKINQPSFSFFDPAISIREIIRPYQHNFNVEMDLIENRRIKFDQTHFYQIITNIFQNAMDVTKENKIIKIVLKISRSYLVLQIIDQGIGIDEKDLNKIFEPYFTKKKRGTGLGLALVKRLIEANNSFIRVISEEGKGSNFEIIMEDIIEHSNN